MKNVLGTLLKNLVITFKKQSKNRKNPLKMKLKCNSKR